MEGQTLVIDCPDMETVKRLTRNRRQLADLPTSATHFKLALCGKEISPALPTSQNRAFDLMINAITDQNFQRTLDEINRHELPVCLTDHLHHRCLYLNDKFTVDRIVLTREEYCSRGLNFLWYWRDSMDDLERLINQLNQTGRYENFKYRMRRPDGAMCWYVMDYELCEMFGLMVRKSVSHDWGIISPAPDQN